MMPHDHLTLAPRLKTVPGECAGTEASGTEVDDKDIEPRCQIHVPPLIPDGLYEVGFVRAEQKKLWGRK